MRVEAFYDEIADRYDGAYSDRIAQAEDRLLRRWIRERSMRLPILDLGCGTGLLLDLLGIPPWAYQGVDISDGMLERAREKHPGHRLLKYDFDEGVPDVHPELCRVTSPLGWGSIVSLYGSLSYSANWQAIMHRAIDSLIPGGSFFFMVAGPSYGQPRLAELAQVPFKMISSFDLRKEAHIHDHVDPESVRVRGFIHPERSSAWKLRSYLPNGMIDSAMKREMADADYHPDEYRFLILSGENRA